jgi:alcohol dehydrogenase class IV
VVGVRAAIDVPHTLAGLKVDGSRRDLIAEMAIVDPTAGGNPVPLTKEGALRIFDAALAGEL